MPEKKAQHYVPKFYLRLFSFRNNRKEIGLYNITNKFFKSNVPIKSQGKGDFFYGKDGIVEDLLQNLEDKAAPVITRIISESEIPNRLSEDYMHLFTFSLLFIVRTKNHSEKIEQTMNLAVKKILSYDERYKNRIDDYELKLIDQGAFSIVHSIDKLKNALDLKLKVIVNETSINFLTSDNPLAAYNQFLEKKKHLHGRHGLYTKGLQLFLPISPRHTLIFYDEWSYKIGDKKQDFIYIKNENDINTLNFLQFANCGDQVFFNEGIGLAYIENLVPWVNRYRISEKSLIKQVGTRIGVDGNEHIQFQIDNQNISARLDFSFINQTKKAKHHILNNFSVQLRNEHLRPLQMRT